MLIQRLEFLAQTPNFKNSSRQLKFVVEDANEFRSVDVTARNDADDLSSAGLAGEGAGDGAGAGAFGDDVIVGDEKAQCVGDRIEIGDK